MTATRMTDAEMADFDRAHELGRRAACCHLVGDHFTEAHLWALAAAYAVSVKGKRACVANSHDAYRLFQASRGQVAANV